MEKNPNNISINLNGYRVIYMPDHPRSMKNETWRGFVYEHIVVAEKYNGALGNDDVVHHLDGNRSNNRQENLLILSRSQHNKLHAWISSGSPGILGLSSLEAISNAQSQAAQPSFCSVCGLTLQEKQLSFCSRECTNLAGRKTKRPLKQDLLEDLQTMSILAIGKKYGVSDNAVRKWMKGYAIRPSP